MKKYIKEYIKENIPEITLLTGLFFIIVATFLINFIAGIYAIGIILVFMAIFLAYKPKTTKERR